MRPPEGLGPLAAERDRWVLWVPVAFGAGIATYFALPEEPPLWAAVACLGLAVALAVGQRRRPGLAIPLLGAALLAAGVGAGRLATDLTATPLWDDRGHRGTMEGVVVGLDRQPRGARVTLDEVVFSSRGGEMPPPHLVRVRLLPSDPAPAIGSRIRVFGELSGPRRPVAPGAFDFRRWAYFQGLSATGFAMGHAELVADPAAGGFWQAIDAARADMVARIDQALDPPAAGFAAALLTGQRGGVDDATYEVLRDAGLAHLLAISGLHVGLVAGGVFVLVRLLGSLNERLAVTRPIKKWAAVAALLSAVAYMLVVGAPVPTQRAVLMTGLVLLGVLADREALSMRLVAWAALVVLVLAPDSVVSASFQMSFAAVVGLVAAYEWLAPRMGRWRRGGGMARAVLLYLAGVLVSTAVAGLATAPFSLFHFQAVATAGALANLLAVPLTAFWIMPFGMAAYLAMPLGMEEGPLYLMGLGVSALVWIAGEAAQLAGGSARFAPPPAWGLALLSLGGLWLCLWRRPWRLWGCLAMAAGLASSTIERPPDLLVSDTADLIGLIDGEPRHLVLTSLNRERFAARAWADRFAAGSTIALADLPADRQRCDGLGCIVHHAGTTLALVADPRALDEDCAAADLLVAEVPVFQPCAAVVIDRFDVWRHGAHAVWLGDGPPRIETVAEHEGDRPWALTR